MQPISRNQDIKETQMQVVLWEGERHTASKTRRIARLAVPKDMLIMPPRTSFGKYLHNMTVRIYFGKG